jgi:uncharacterized protein (TIGR00369 family)
MGDQKQRQPTPFDALLGIEAVHAADGEAEFRLDLTAAHCNRRGVAHGGVVASLLDVSLGAAVVSTTTPEEWCGTLELSVQFRDPARHGPLTGRGRVERRGRRVAFASGEIIDARGRVVAAAHGVWTVWPEHPDQRATKPQS